MKKHATWSKASENYEANSACKHPHSVAERVAFSPGEFAASFGRSETWGYRQLYSGRVKAIQISGRLLIPKSEIDRLLAEAVVYDGVPERAPKVKRASASSRRGTKVEDPTL